MAKRPLDEPETGPSLLLDSTQPIHSEHLHPSECEPHPKYAQLDENLPELDLISCNFPPHRQLPFPTYEAYEIHYNQFHVNRCSECGKNFPSDLLLSRHIEENHDPIMVERMARGEKTLGCFVEGCSRRCLAFQKRRAHLIDKHHFPKNYNFKIVHEGIDAHTSMLETRNRANKELRKRSNRKIHRGKRQSIDSKSQGPADVPSADTAASNILSGEDQNSNLPDLERASEAVDVASLTKSMSALKFVPLSVMVHRPTNKTFR